jgi:hypothetical protein
MSEFQLEHRSVKHFLQKKGNSHQRMIAYRNEALF